MAGNEQLIDSVIDPAAIKQVADLTTSLEALQAQLLDNIKASLQLNSITATSSTSFSKFESNSSKSSIAISKVTEANHKAAIAATNLEKAQAALAAQEARTEKAQASAKAAQERSTEAAKKALSPYAQLSKELEKLRSHAKDVGVEFGENSKQFKAAAKPVQELDERLKGIDKTLGQSQRNVGNYGDAFKGVLTQYIPFGEGTIRIGENLKALGIDMEGSAEKLGTLGAGFAEFTTIAFIAAIASAAYYLSQFKSTGNEVEKFLGGLKEQFANFGGNIVEGLKGFSAKSLLNLIPGVAIYNAGKNFKESFAKGVDDAEVKIELVNADEIDENSNKILKAESERNRALAASRKLDITERQAYIKKAQEAEQKILDNQKENSNLYIANAIAIGDKRNKLTDKQVDRLLKGDLKYAQELSENGQQFSTEGYELYKKGIDKKLAYQQGATNQITQLQVDADNMQLKADRALAQQQFLLDKSRLTGALEKSKLTLDNDKATYNEKIKANEEFVNQSLTLAKKERDNELGAAGLGGRGGADSRLEKVKRLTIEQDYQNQINKIKTEGLNNDQKIEKQRIELIRKELEDIINSNAETEKLTIQGLQESNEKQLIIIQNQADKELAIVAAKYEKRKINEKQYQKQITEIQDQANVDRLAQEAFNAQAILEVKQAAENAKISVIGGYATKDEIDKIKANSGVAGAQNAVDKAGQALQSGINTQTQHQTKSDDISVPQFEKGAADDTIQAIDMVTAARDSAYQKQVQQLERIGHLIDVNAGLERASIERSLDTNANKTRRLAVLEAQTASKKEALLLKENQLKNKQAKADKEATIAKLTAQGALAVITALSGGPVLGEILAIAAAALVATELAIAIATPLPTFAKGGTTKGGGLIWGEKGTELAIEPGGKSYLSPDHATFTTMPAGTKIIPHDQLMKPKAMNGYTSTSTDKAVVNAINNNTLTLKKAFQDQKSPRVNVYVDNDFANYSKRLNR